MKLDIDRVRASELGLNEKEVVGNVITALTSDGMIAPSFWVDPKSGNDYLLTVQYPEDFVKNLADLGVRAVARRPLGQADAPRHGQPYPAHQSPDRSGPLPAPPHHGRLRVAHRARI